MDLKEFFGLPRPRLLGREAKIKLLKIQKRDLFIALNVFFIPLVSLSAWGAAVIPKGWGFFAGYNLIIALWITWLVRYQVKLEREISKLERK